MRQAFLCFVLMVSLCIVGIIPHYAQSSVHYYFRTMGIQDGLSQNTVNQLLQDKQGFMWFGTKDGLNRYDGISFREYKKENSRLGGNCITALCEDYEGKIWVGTEEGIFVYHPIEDDFTTFNHVTKDGESIKNYITMITRDEEDNIWISSEREGLFFFKQTDSTLYKCFNSYMRSNITRFWIDGSTCWIALYMDNLYMMDIHNPDSLHPFRDANGCEPFYGDVINSQIVGPYNCIYVASNKGLTEINLTTFKTRRLLDGYIRTLEFKSDEELWAGAETGIYIYNLKNNNITHLTVPEQDDSYALSDNAIYSLYCDKEKGMWIGSYFGGVNYYPYQWTYFEKLYPKDNLDYFGRRVREVCEGNDGSLWIGTEDKGLFNYNLETKTVTPFEHPLIYKNIHGLCLDGDELWVGTFSGGLNRVNLKTGNVVHYSKGERENTLPADDAFSICKTTIGEIWIGTTSGLLKYNRTKDDFIRIEALKHKFVYDILEDYNGNIWVATFSDGLYKYDVQDNQWKTYTYDANDSTSLSSNKIISIYEDSKKRLWFTTMGGGFVRYDMKTDNFVRYDFTKELSTNVIYKIVEDKFGKLWITSNQGLVCFNPETNEKHIYTTANGLLSNQFNFQSGYRDKNGRIYLGNINGLNIFDPETFVENTFLPPIVISDFYLFNKRLSSNEPDSPLKQNITYADEIVLNADQNSFSCQVAALSFQAPEMNRLDYKLEGYDSRWYTVGKGSMINYANLPFGSYKLRIKGCNADGNWNDVERVLHIHIRPPFYLSNWAILSYVILGIVFIILSLLYYKRSSLLKQTRAMEAFEREKEKELYTAKIDFFTNIAHEIRTPLTLIKIPLENVLTFDNLEDEVKEDLDIMYMNTNRLLDLVNQLLDFRKTETKGFKLGFLECNVSDILRGVCKRFQPMAKQKNLDFRVDAPELLQASVDKEGVIKIFSNLLTNAVKYSDTYIQIRLYYDEKNLYMSISNDGIVVPPEMREDIFKPFVQLKSEDSKPISGSGIGLPLARTLAELHGGNLVMDDSIRQNTFILSLPLHHEGTVMVKDLEYNIEQEKEESTSMEYKYTLLIVEDNSEMRTFLKKKLSSEYQVLTAENGVAALMVLSEHTVNLVISDIMMSQMDGLELCRQMKSKVDYSHIPIILLTAKTTIQSRIEGMKHGADIYIEKPFSVEYLRACIENLLENREKLRITFVNSPFVQTNSMAFTKADEIFLKSLNEIVQANMQDPDFKLDDIASQLNMSRSSLNRKIRGVLDMSPNDYLRLERLKKAGQLLKNGECKINEVCYMVGFNTPSYFTKCFQKQFGVLPKEFAK